MKKIGIIGGGASGVITALLCQRRLGSEFQIFICDPAQVLGRGKAYSNPSSDYILNTPAGKMSVFPDFPDDFERWVLSFDPEIQNSNEWPFVPRYYFGLYLEHHLKQALAESGRIVHIRSKVIGLSIVQQDYQINLSDGTHQLCEYLIIATGYRDTPNLPSFVQTQALQHKILHSQEIHKIPESDYCGHILIVGSSLTAIDVWRKLAKNKNLTFTFLSRRGLLPCSQDFSEGQIKFPVLVGLSALQIFQLLRSIHNTTQLSWVIIANHVRKQVQKIWTFWSAKEKSSFVRNLKPYWEVIRHRIPPCVFEDLARDLSSHRITIRAGKISSINSCDTKLCIQFTDRHSTQKQEFKAHCVIYAIGSSVDQNLYAENKITGLQLGPAGTGYINAGMRRAWVVGPASKAMFWEVIAISDIREQAQKIVEKIAQINRVLA